MSETKITPRPQRTNANRHTVRGMAALETSIANDGWIGAITVAADGETFDGSARVEKTAENGMLDEAIVVDSDGTRPIVVRRTDIATATDPRAVRLGIAANRVASLNLEWEPDVLASIADSGVDLSSLFTADEWADVAMPALPDAGAGGDDFDATPEDGPTRTNVGELWSIGGVHRLLVGDCTDAANVARLMGGARADMLLSDPPYGIGWDTDYTRFTTEYGTKRTNYPVVENDDKPFDPRPFFDFPHVVLWGANWYCQHIPIGSWLIWDKRHPNGTAWLSDAEIAWAKGGKGVYIYSETVQGAHRQERAEHPTQKPIGLMIWCIERAKEVQSVYDPFLGSGTTLIAAHRTGCRCFGCEIAPRYADVILRRAEAEGLEVARING